MRIIASTNRNLEEAVQRGEFRADLFYRLNIFPIHVPPLRQRAEDVPALVWQFVEQFCQSMGKRIEEIPTPSMKRLQQYDWPGNIRELRNFIERLLIMNVGSSLNVDLAILASGLDTPPPTLNTSHPAASSHLSLAEVRRQHILRVLQSTGWRIRGPKGAARYLGCAESSLRSRMKQLGIVKPQPYRAHPRN